MNRRAPHFSGSSWPIVVTFLRSTISIKFLEPASVFPFLDIFAALCEETCGRSDIDVRNQQTFLAVRLVAEQRSVRPRHRRSGGRADACDGDGCEIAGVLGGATQDRFLME